MADFSYSYSKDESSHAGILTLKRQQMEYPCDDDKIFGKLKEVTEKNWRLLLRGDYAWIHGDSSSKVW